MDIHNELTQLLANPDDPPARFLDQVQDDRLRRLIVCVWRRLPLSDRLFLRERVVLVTDDPHRAGIENESRKAGPECDWLGYAGLVTEGLAWSVEYGIEHVVALAPRAREIESDAALVAIIAHEFAHVVLRHNIMTCVVADVIFSNVKDGYTRRDLARLGRWHEDAADLQVWHWDFRDELVTFLDAHPERVRPGWYVAVGLDEHDDLDVR